jgi:hypothetical protein
MVKNEILVVKGVFFLRIRIDPSTAKSTSPSEKVMIVNSPRI